MFTSVGGTIYNNSIIQIILSIVDVDFMICFQVANQTLWLRNLILELSVVRLNY